MPQSIAGTIAALYAACQTVYTDDTAADGMSALVTMGAPGQYQPNVIVAVGMAVRHPITKPTMGTTRSRDAFAEIDVVISVYVPGGEEAQATAFAQAFDLQSQLETYLRTGTNSTLSGACLEAWISDANCLPDIAYQTFDDPNVPDVATGRVATNTVTVTARIRY